MAVCGISIRTAIRYLPDCSNPAAIAEPKLPGGESPSCCASALHLAVQKRSSGKRSAEASIVRALLRKGGRPTPPDKLEGL